MAPLRFSANLSWLFPELPGLSQRLRAAGGAGFPAVEMAWPYGEAAGELAQAAAREGVRVVLINTPPGAGAGGTEEGTEEGPEGGTEGGTGRAAVRGGPGLRAAEREPSLGPRWTPGPLCPPRRAGKAGIGSGGSARPAGCLPEGPGPGRAVCPGAGLPQENIVGLLEPINTRLTDPRYFLDTPQQAAAILQKVGRPNLQLQMDVFHWQIMDGNLTGNLREFLPLIGHIQIAQVPGRHEPDSPGELNFPYLFQLLEDEGYKGYVGCEYSPLGDTLEGLGWLHSYWETRGLQPKGQ
uniref:Putative hydroxypyruvate isomerase n=1 Tax=Ornithorhynchus anatinus TaxID=9258 RepID=A0A6I8N983_ORNAN